MNTPKMSEFDGWRASAVGRWFFEVVLQGYADASAGINGRAVGSLEESQGKEILTYVKNAGVINGVEYVIELDPFIEERQELEDETESDRKTATH
jgi:hypothetical protein